MSNEIRKTVGHRYFSTNFLPAPLIPLLLVCFSILFCATSAEAEDGYELWLRYSPAPGVTVQIPSSVETACSDPSETLHIAANELQAGFGILLEEEHAPESVLNGHPLILLSPECQHANEGSTADFEAYQPEEYRIQTQRNGTEKATVISGASDVAVLYGAYDYLMRIGRGENSHNLDVSSAPKVKLRLLNHWDNLDRHVERGYAGQSIWDWHRLPGYIDQRYIDYARANASIGINGTVLTNVNADATVLTPAYIEKVAALADVFRPYGIRVYLTARFSAPIELGGIETADPLDPLVQSWWHEKVEEIYAKVPDFGGFLVKANSEGQPGPQDYDRSHADGANMLADALASHGGHLIWRAFVYSADNEEDRVKQAYDEFVPLDGQFRDNVLIQVKNGPLDFQPREPFHPMFGSMPQTPLMLEAQITKEYLGFSTHLAYLGTLWEEVLRSDTFASNEGSTVAQVIDGSLHQYPVTGLAGVANIGTDRNWSGSIFDQANWFAFGRLAWDPYRDSADIAQEWAELTFSADIETTSTIVKLMKSSRETIVDYMTPLGLTHLMGTGHHYGPAPWVDNLGRADWNPYYYHRATKEAIGVDRTSSGTDALSQYSKPLNNRWSDLEKTPDSLLLWFHRLPWSHRMRSGRTLWDELVHHYDRGVRDVAQMQETWQSLDGEIDAARHKQISQFLNIQLEEAKWWRDASLAYWMSVNGLQLPKGSSLPDLSLAEYVDLQFPYAPGQGG